MDIDHLPIPSTPLLGRDHELALLHHTFADPASRVLVLVAPGGTGKSALSDAWLKQLAPDYGGTRRVFGWSFYSQGHHRLYNDSGAFFRAVLPFLGQGEVPRDEIDKGRALAACVARQPCFLVLDGLEPLQLDRGVHDGALQDSALREFFVQLPRALRQQPRSFVLVSSRQPLAELAQWEDGGYVSHDLANLSAGDGAALLARLGVHGSEAERTQLAHDSGGHALTLTLLGKLLQTRFNGEIVAEWRNFSLLPSTPSSPSSPSTPDAGHRHARRILAWYAEHLDDPARRFVSLLGLFDRPMGWREKAALFAQAEWAAPLAQLSRPEFCTLETRLAAAGLLAPASAERTQWDCHALVRAWAGQFFSDTEPAAFRQAQRVLFAHYQSVPEQEQPEGLEALQPLYRAVVHGCLAGEYQAAQEVYDKRIQRGDQFYSSKKLGAYAQDLSALAAFFPQGWRQPEHTGLSVAHQAWLLAEAAFCLMSLGRLREALGLREAGLELRIKIEDWKNASVAARNLTDLHLPLGDLAAAEDAARRAVEYVEQAEDLFQQKNSHAYLGAVLHRCGRMEEAAAAFRRAEEIQAQFQPQYPRLYSVWGAQYCGFLLDMGRATLQGGRHLAEQGVTGILEDATPRGATQAVLERGEEIFRWYEQASYDPPLDHALNHLTLARAHSALGQVEKARAAFAQALAGIAATKLTIFAPPFHLTHAAFLLNQGELKKTREELDAAWAIIRRCDMALYAVDANLLEARYHELAGKTEKTAHFQALAEKGIGETGYRLRERVGPF